MPGEECRIGSGPVVNSDLASRRINGSIQVSRKTISINDRFDLRAPGKKVGPVELSGDGNSDVNH